MPEKISLRSLKKEHDLIEIELEELETVMEDEEFNYSNLKHVFEKLCRIWDSHETKEKNFFDSKINEFKIENHVLHFNNPELKGHKKVIQDAIKSGSEFDLKVSLDTDGKMLIEKLRRDISKDNELYERILGKNNLK